MTRVPNGAVVFFSSLVTGALVLALGGGCSRRAEIRDDPEQGLVVPHRPKPPDAGTPTVASDELQDPRFLECGARLPGECLASNDFPCNFEEWVTIVAQRCQERMECRSADWLTVELDEQGCVTRIGMTRPKKDFVACLVEEMGPYRCPCDAMGFDYFLGVGDPSCEQDAGSTILR